MFRLDQIGFGKIDNLAIPWPKRNLHDPYFATDHSVQPG